MVHEGSVSCYACPDILARWDAVLNGEYACGLCTLSGVRLGELGIAALVVEWASKHRSLS